MRAFIKLLCAVTPIAALAAACSASQGTKVFGSGGGETGGGGPAATTGQNAGGSSTGIGSGIGGGLGFDGGPSGTGGSQPGQPCNSGPSDDMDKDGFTGAQGDCNDCDPNVNPNAIDVGPQSDGDGGMTMATDNDCDGKITLDVVCDDMLNDVAEPNPMGAAWAVELCKKSTGVNSWGVVEAQWVLPDGTPPPAGNPANANFQLGHGVLSGFGPNVKVQAGKHLLALSSGTARQPTDPGYMSVNGFDKGYSSGSPMGFPKESPACPGVTTGQPHDGAGIEMTIRTPSNAHGFSFDFDFFTFEWPGFICSQYNDFFVAILSPIPMGQSDGNISFDSQGNPVSVNNAFLEVCGCPGNPPASCMAGGKTFPCSLGDKPLVGTGFGVDMGQDHGSTYWLVTKAPVEPNSEIILRWGVYDSGDGVLDTTALIDNWQWIATAGTTVGTVMVPVPK